MVITHPEKILFPDDGITKGDLAKYYESVAALMLPHVSGRPITMERYPAGIGKKGFWQKSVEKGFPKWLERVDVPKKDGVVHHPVITDTRSLMWLVNQNTITCHVWTSRVPELYYPDICVFDLDPSSTDPAPVRAAAVGLRDLLETLGLPSWVKTTGLEGLPHRGPLDGKANMDEVATLCESGRPAVRQPRARSPDAGIQPRPIARAASTWTPDGTATARRSQRPTRCAPNPARRCPHPARGKRWNAARSTLIPSPSTPCPHVSRRAGDIWADLLRSRRSLKAATEKLKRLL